MVVAEGGEEVDAGMTVEQWQFLGLVVAVVVGAMAGELAWRWYQGRGGR